MKCNLYFYDGGTPKPFLRMILEKGAANVCDHWCHVSTRSSWGKAIVEAEKGMRKIADQARRMMELRPEHAESYMRQFGQALCDMGNKDSIEARLKRAGIRHVFMHSESALRRMDDVPEYDTDNLYRDIAGLVEEGRPF